MENLGSRLLKISGNRIKGRLGGDAWVPFIALRDIGDSVADILGSGKIFAGTEIILAGEFLSGNELALLSSGVAEGRKFRYKPANELLLRLTRPRFYKMRKFFERQGSLLHIDGGSMMFFPRLPSAPLTMDDFIKANADRLFGGKMHS